MANKLHHSPLDTQNAADMLVKEQLKILEERVTGLEEKLTKDACIENVPKKNPEVQEQSMKRRPP